MKKKFKVTLAVFLIVILGCFSNTFAAVKETKTGTLCRFKLFKDAAQNDIKEGSVLTSPEKGWTRYDDADKDITYSGSGWIAKNMSYNPDSSEYNSTVHYTSNSNCSYKFDFYGNKLRMLGHTTDSAYGTVYHSDNITVIIDGIVRKPMCQTYSNNNSYKTLYYQIDLDEREHSVECVSTQDNRYFELDALDIFDANGKDELRPYKVLVSNMFLTKTTDSLTLGSTDTLTATVTPDNVTNKALKWISSDSTIVSVDDNGKITALKAGTATITAATTDGSNLSSSCTVTVKDKEIDKSKLIIYMGNQVTREYYLTEDEIENFINWYDARANDQTPKSYYVFKVPAQGVLPARKDYVLFNKIKAFEVE